MKILQIIPTLSKGGAERLVIDIVKHLNKKDTIEARLVIFRDEINYDISQIKEFISIIPSYVELSITKKWEVNVLELKDFIKDFQPDVIHTHLFEAELVSRFCKYPKAHWFSHVHDNMIELNNFSWLSISKKSITRWYEKKVLFQYYKKNRGTHFIAISKHSKSYITSVQSKYSVTLLHNAIDVKRFKRPVQNQRSGTTKLKSLTTHDSPLTLNLINIGSFVPKKNQTFILDIILELNKQGFQTNCIFLGDGPLKIYVMNRAEKLGVSNQCLFLGNVENVEEYLWGSHVYVHTATYEPFGLVLLEAMASGLPVISLDGKGNRDIIEHQKNGVFLKEQNAEQFRNELIELKKNPNEYLRYVKEGRKYSSNYDIEQYRERLVNCYSQLIGNNQ